MRTNSYATLVILLTQSPSELTATIVAAGGGSGMFNISYGANVEFAGNAAELLRAHGFKSLK